MRKEVSTFAGEGVDDTSSVVVGGGGERFEDMSAARTRKYYLVGGKGGVGKTSLSASLAVKSATSGQHPTLIVSTDPAHSLSDSLAQDVSSGVPVAVEGTDGMLWAMEIDTTQAKSEFSSFRRARILPKARKRFYGERWFEWHFGFVAGFKVRGVVGYASAWAGRGDCHRKGRAVHQGREVREVYENRVRHGADGHTLRLLSLPEFLDKSIGKIVRLRQKLTSAGDMVKGLFGQENENQDVAVEKLENLKKRLQEVKDLFRNKETTEFVIATIPTVLGISESGRLLKSLRDETVPCTKIVVNQILNVDVDDFQEAADACDVTAGEKLKTANADSTPDVQTLVTESERLATASRRAVSFVRMKEKDQRKAMEMLDTDSGLRTLKRIEAPLFDLEIRGVPALEILWRPSVVGERAHEMYVYENTIPRHASTYDDDFATRAFRSRLRLRLSLSPFPPFFTPLGRCSFLHKNVFVFLLIINRKDF